MLYWIIGIAVGIALMWYAGPSVMAALTATWDWVKSFKK